MPEVPGDTLGLVPPMAQAARKDLHIAVNPASALPDVPAAFVWRDPDGSEIEVKDDAACGAVNPAGSRARECRVQCPHGRQFGPANC